jgi:hypothetical protein
VDAPAAPPRGPALDVIFNLGGGCCQTHRQRPPWGLPSTPSSTSVVDAAGPADSAPQGACHSSTLMVDADGPTDSAPLGPTIDVVFHISGRHCWTRHQHPPRGPPSTSSSISVVDADRPASSAPRGPTINIIFNLGGGRCQTHPVGSAPQGARHRRLATSGNRCQYLLPTPIRGPLVNYQYWTCYKQGIS